MPIPPSKSHTQRALLFAMLGKGRSQIENVLLSNDTLAMIKAIQQFNAKVVQDNRTFFIDGNFEPPHDIIDAAGSGQILRFIGAIGSLLPCYITITGDASIRTRRPVKPLLSGLRQLGAVAESGRGDGYAPIIIQGPIHPGKCRISGEDSQPVSALLMATSFLKGPSEILIDHPGETPWIDLTLDWLRRLGSQVEHQDYSHYFVPGSLTYPGFSTVIPGDFSSASFPIIAALITGSTLSLTGLNPNDVQGDKVLIDWIQKMGGRLHWEEKTLHISPSNLQGIKIDVNTCIDALPIFAVLGCFAKGKTTLYNGQIARVKESDRISCICKELQKMGARITEKEDGLEIEPSDLMGCEVDSHKDHRIAMALCVAALSTKGTTVVKGAHCIEKSYPDFVLDFQRIGASMEYAGQTEEVFSS